MADEPFRFILFHGIPGFTSNIYFDPSRRLKKNDPINQSEYYEEDEGYQEQEEKPKKEKLFRRHLKVVK